ncbi:N-acetyltransferase [Sphingomonas sabuli]|uniref:N-acetyltransferase n=1 Tax=Sphingomonas sabuli TaxID=2764186 RepID=A0A7G9L303_9SPHN|nr:GNAT family N-acetyltransferase [Sphingomonas sabuli]QNM83002.1 N-acetyltransferase [Sphingomonas sabuli]
MTDQPAVRDNTDKHRFEIDLGDGDFAIAEYRLHGDDILFTHTLVPETHEGQGLGTALIKAALASARKRGLKVHPHCKFFAAYMKEHADVQDLLTPEWRAKLGVE